MGANTTGAFSDATDTDSTASDDKIAVGVTPGSTALVITIIAATFTSTNTVTHMLSFQDLSSQPTITGTYYSTPSGVTAYKRSSYNSTEANSKLRMRKAFTVNNFATFVTGGSGGTLNSRKNGANGNITADLNVGSAQLVQDTTHSDNQQSETILTGNLVILAPIIAMTFTPLILRVQTETVYLHVQLTTLLRPLILQLQHITG
jgi:hypothetical protein